MYYFSDAADSSPGITELGFHFLLMDTASQVWYFLQQYLATAEVSIINRWKKGLKDCCL